MAAVDVDIVLRMTFSAEVQLPVVFAEGTTGRGRTITGLGDQWGRSIRLNATTVPKPLAVLPLEITLGASATEVDFSAAKIVGAVDGSGDPTSSEDLDGRRVLCWHFTARRQTGVNADGVTVRPKAGPTGYLLHGAGNTEGVVIQPDGDDGDVCESSLKSLVSNSGERVIEFVGTTGDQVRGAIYFQ